MAAEGSADPVATMGNTEVGDGLYFPVRCLMLGKIWSKINKSY